MMTNSSTPAGYKQNEHAGVMCSIAHTEDTVRVGNIIGNWVDG